MHIQTKQRRKIHITTATALAAAILCTIIAAFFFDIPADNIGLRHGAPIYTRLTYHFFHNGLLHLAVNTYVFCLYAFRAHISVRRMAAAFIIAALAPATTDIPAVGLSGVLYALTGFALAQLPARLVRPAALFVAVAILLPEIVFPARTAIVVHTWCAAVAYIVMKGYAAYSERHTRRG